MTKPSYAPPPSTRFPHHSKQQPVNQLVFKEHEAVTLLRKACRLQDKAPILTVHCQHQLGGTVIEYESFLPQRFIFHVKEKLVEIKGTIGKDGPPQTVYWSPDKQQTESRTNLLFVSTSEDDFHRHFYLYLLANVEILPLTFKDNSPY